MKLENEIFRLDLLVKEYKEKLKFKNAELSKLQENLSSENLKLKNISDDNVRLLKTWEHTISVAGKRDELYSTLKARLE